MTKVDFNKRPDDYSSGQTNVTDAVFQKATVQMMVYNECRVRLNRDGLFNKDEVLEHLGLTDVADRIWWEQIVKRLKAGLTAFTQKKNYNDRPEVEIYPVVRAFFKADSDAKQAMQTGVKTATRQWDDSFTGRYLAGGYGKKTAGWVLAHHANGRFAIRRAEVMIDRMNGIKGRIANEADTVVKKLISDGTTANVTTLATKAGIPVPKSLTKTP